MTKLAAFFVFVLQRHHSGSWIISQSSTGDEGYLLKESLNLNQKFTMQGNIIK